MEKLIYLLGDTEPGSAPRARTDLRDALLGAAPELDAAGARPVCLHVADLDDPVADSFPQLNRDGLIDAAVSLWLDSVDTRARVEEVLAPRAKRLAGYLVTESVPRAWDARDWRDGERSPGVTLVTTFPKPEKLDDATFLDRWHGSHTPLSLEIHPLLQYVRNAVARPLTPGAPPFRAIVAETVASAEVAADPERFYRSSRDQQRAVRDLLGFVELETLSAVLMSEYLLSS